MTNTIDLNAMTVAQLKEFYSTLSNPISVIGTGKNGYKVKKDWIDAIEKSLISVNDNDQLATKEVIEEAILGEILNHLPEKIDIGSYTKPHELDIIPDWLEVPCSSSIEQNKYIHYQVNISHPKFPVELLSAENEFVVKDYLSDTLIRFERLSQFLHSIGFFDVGYYRNYYDHECKGDFSNDEIPFYGEGTEPYWEDLEELGRSREVHSLDKREIFGVPISFGYTLDRLQQGIKTVTRRTWADRYAQMFVNAYKKGKLIQAFDKDRRYGGTLIGYLELTCEPYKESLFDMPDGDVINEGFPEMNWKQFTDHFFYDLVRDWDSSVSMVWVIRFRFIPCLSHSEVLKRHGFTLSENCIFSKQSEMKCEVNGWQVVLTPGFKKTSAGSIFFQKIDLINLDSGETWSKDVVNRPMSQNCILIAEKVILDINYNLPNYFKGAKYEGQKVR